MKVVINKCYGGFSLSPQAVLWLFRNGYDGEGFKTLAKEYFRDTYDCGVFGFKNKLKDWNKYLETSANNNPLFLTIFTPDEQYVLSNRDVERHHPLLVKCVEKLKDKANGRNAKLEVIEIPDGVEYTIEEYDGMEHIAETHRKWG